MPTLRTPNTVASGAAPPPQLLTYTTSSDPQPLAGGQTGAVTLTVGLITAPVYCNEILLTVMVGPDANCLFQDDPVGSISSKSWSRHTAEFTSGAHLGLEDGFYATVKFTTLDPAAFDINYPLALTLSGTVGTSPGGSFPIYIHENSGPTPGAMTPHGGTVAVASGTAPFHLVNFVATATGAPTLPRTEFANGEQVTLSWESNGDRYALWRKGETQPFWTGPETTATFAGPTADTTYFLIASSPDPDVTGPLYDTLTITISDPDLTPKSVVIAEGNPANPYAAALDVQAGWTRIGCFNTQSIPGSSAYGGMVVGWNRSSGAAETNLYNVFPNAGRSFVFSQLVDTSFADLLIIAGDGVTTCRPLTVQGNAQVTGSMTANSVASNGAVSGSSFSIGGWTISVDPGGKLLFRSPTGAVVGFDSSGGLILPGNLTCQAVVASGVITTQGKRVVASGNVVYLGNGQGFLNGTRKVGGPGNGWNAAAYWQDWNPPDGDSNITITIVS